MSKISGLILLAIVTLSCAPNKKLLYLQDTVEKSVPAANYETTLQPDDNLLITITSDSPELANDFNLMYITARSTDVRTMAGNDALYTYLIDQRGEIDFPVLGKIKLAALTRIEAEDKIRALLKDHLVNPGVIVRILDFRVSVLGEVVRPGPQIINGERITILEALSAAGDLTIYGKRNDIMIIREKEGVKTINHIDITNAGLLSSPYYYLAHNDVIYVKPNKTRVNSSVVGPNITVAISAISLLITIIALSTR